MGKFIIRKVNTGYKFDLLAANGESILSSEVYTSAAVCLRGVESVRKQAAATALADLTEPESPVPPNPRYELYRDRSGKFRFRLRSRNGKIIAVSSSYVTRSGCRDGIDSVRLNGPDAVVETVDEA